MMEIKRFNADFGNSTANFTMDSYYFEIPTCVVEISQKKADSLLTNSVDDVNDLLDRLLISTENEGEKKYYLIGKLAEKNPYANSHVGKMHDKIKSDIPYATYLAALAYFYKKKNPNGENVAALQIDSMKMMLPIWLLKKESKFSVALDNMAKRFEGEHRVELLTPGMETELTITVNHSKCYIESEVARWALKYKIENEPKSKTTVIKKRSEAKKFEKHPVVLVDIGGGSTDAVLLTKGLNAPISSDSFQVIKINPFLGALEELLKEKLIEHFEDLRSLENFIVANYKTQKYVLKNPNTGVKNDLTAPIIDMLREYAKLLVYKVTEKFNSISDEVLKYVYIGGETPILEPYIKEAVAAKTTEDIMENHHYFLDELLEDVEVSITEELLDEEVEVFRPSARTINLVALEILSLNEISKLSRV